MKKRLNGCASINNFTRGNNTVNQPQVAQQKQDEPQEAVTMMPVESSNILAIGYDQPSLNLFVTFKDGNTYRHMGVPEDLWLRFKDAESQGKFYHANIKGKFESEKGKGERIEGEVGPEVRKRVANTQYKIQLTFQVIGPLLASIPDDEMQEYILHRPALGNMNGSSEFLHKFASRLHDIMQLVEKQAQSLQQPQPKAEEQ